MENINSPIVNKKNNETFYKYTKLSDFDPKTKKFTEMDFDEEKPLLIDVYINI